MTTISQPGTRSSKRGQRTVAIERARWITTSAAPAATVAQNGEAPTTARLSTAPRSTVTHASNGICCPKDRRPEARINNSAIKKITKARAAICQISSSEPSPKSQTIQFIYHSIPSSARRLHQLGSQTRAEDQAILEHIAEKN